MAAPTLHRLGNLVVARFHPTWLRAVIPPNPMTAAEFLARYPYVEAVMDGAMFRPCDGEPNDYARYQCGQVDYAVLDALTGAFAVPRYPERGLTFLVYSDGAVQVREGVAPAWWGTPWLAWQGYPALLENGTNVASRTRDTNRTERAALGRHASGDLLFVSGVDSMYGFTESARAVDILDMAYGDGGQSRFVAVRDAQGHVLADDATNLFARRVPSFLCAINPLYALTVMK